jgi:outer membrane protein OmpA-like peptidoglycan-associated protein
VAGSVFARATLGAAGFALFGGVYVFGPFGAPKIEEDLSAAARSRLKMGGDAWAIVHPDGQLIRLSGVAPDEAARTRAIEASLKAIGPGGRAFGGVTRVDAAGVVIARAPKFVALDDFNFEAAFRDGVLSLTGMTPSEDARQALVAAFSGDKTARIDDRTTTARLAEGQEWLATMDAVFRALSMLDAGEVRQFGRSIAISGSAKDAASADAAESIIDGARGPFAIEAQMTRPELSASNEFSAAKKAKICQDAINRALNGRRLEFRRNSARLSVADRALLENFSRAINACSDQTIIVEGHTDWDGARDANLALSARRAEAVKAYLADLGSKAALEVRAFGESRPVASNQTAAGRARNRRIDFVVAGIDQESD